MSQLIAKYRRQFGGPASVRGNVLDLWSLGSGFDGPFRAFQRSHRNGRARHSMVKAVSPSSGQQLIYMGSAPWLDALGDF